MITIMGKAETETLAEFNSRPADLNSLRHMQTVASRAGQEPAYLRSFEDMIEEDDLSMLDCEGEPYVAETFNIDTRFPLLSITTGTQLRPGQLAESAAACLCNAPLCDLDFQTILNLKPFIDQLSFNATSRYFLSKSGFAETYACLIQNNQNLQAAIKTAPTIDKLTELFQQNFNFSLKNLLQNNSSNFQRNRWRAVFSAITDEMFSGSNLYSSTDLNDIKNLTPIIIHDTGVLHRDTILTDIASFDFLLEENKKLKIADTSWQETDYVQFAKKFAYFNWQERKFNNSFNAYLINKNYCLKKEKGMKLEAIEYPKFNEYINGRIEFEGNQAFQNHLEKETREFPKKYLQARFQAGRPTGEVFKIAFEPLLDF